MEQISNQTYFLDNLQQLDKVLSPLNATSIFVLTDSNTLEHCLPSLANATPDLRDRMEILEVPPGEESKCIEVATQLWSSLIELGADRKSVLINLGGGVVTDLGGFVASTFKRGVRFYNVPTSLMAQVDAAIGGKTGIDLGSLKNQVGTFALSEKTLICAEFLETLPRTEFENGFSEVIKHALIVPSGLWPKLQRVEAASFENIRTLVKEAADIKIKIADADPTELGERKKLNFGHTVGHAVESICHKSTEPLQHGQAVAIGMLVEVFLSKKLTRLAVDDAKMIEQLLLKHYANSLRKGFSEKQVWEIMQHDKKNELGKVNCTLLNAIGSSQTDCEISKEDFTEAWEQYESFQKWING